MIREGIILACDTCTPVRVDVDCLCLQKHKRICSGWQMTDGCLKLCRHTWKTLLSMCCPLVCIVFLLLKVRAVGFFWKFSLKFELPLKWCCRYGGGFMLLVWVQQDVPCIPAGGLHKMHSSADPAVLSVKQEGFFLRMQPFPATQPASKVRPKTWV